MSIFTRYMNFLYLFYFLYIICKLEEYFLRLCIQSFDVSNLLIGWIYIIFLYLEYLFFNIFLLQINKVSFTLIISETIIQETINEIKIYFWT